MKKLLVLSISHVLFVLPLAFPSYSSQVSSKIQQIIVFDLGGVLLKEPSKNVFSLLTTKLGKEIRSDELPSLFTLTFKVATYLFNQDCQKNWFLGTMSGYELVSKIKEALSTPHCDFLFKNTLEKSIVYHGAELFLLPENNAQLTSLDNEGLLFVKKCKKNTIKLMILSNWEPQAFLLIKNKFPELFQLFNDEDILIAADTGSIKPDPEIFKYFLNKISATSSSQIFFVDDSLTNIASAKKHGIISVLHRNWAQTEQELIRLGLQLT